MNTLSKYSILVFCLILSSACSSLKSSSSSNVNKTSESMEAVQEEIDRIAEQVDATEASLRNLTNAEVTEIDNAIEQFQSNVSEIENMQEAFSQKAEEMRSQGNNYFTEWRKKGEGYEEPKLREASEQRREELNQAFEEITENSGEVNRALQEYLTDVKEIEDYLNTDPTPEGISAVAPLTQNVEENGQNLKNAIDRMKNAIVNAQSQMGNPQAG